MMNDCGQRFPNARNHSHTLRAAHAEGLVDAVDGFCEGIAFTPEELEPLFERARALGLPVKLHAEQLSNTGGVQLATVQVRQAAPTVVYAQQPAPVVLAPAQPQVIYAPQPPPVSGQVVYTQERR